MFGSGAIAVDLQPRYRGLDVCLALAGWLLVCLALAVMVGWILDVPRLKGIASGYATMKVNGALSFLLGGAALLLRRHGSRIDEPSRPRLILASRVVAALVALIGGLTLLEYAAGVDLGIDELLISDPKVGLLGSSGRISAVTAACLVLFGGAMALPDRPAAMGTVFSAACTVGLVVSFLAAVGHLYDVRALHQPLPMTSIALHSAGALLVSFLGALMSRPDTGWMKICLRPGSVGLIVRVLLPTLVLLPAVLGWVSLQGVRRDFYGPGGLMAMLVTAGTLLLAVVTLVIARRAATSDDALREQQQIYRAVLGNSLDAFIMMDQDSRVLDWNAQAERVFGWSREEALGGAVDQLIMPESSREAHRTGLARFLESGEGPVILSRVVLTAQRRSGEEFPAELIIVPIETEGHWRFGGFVRDVSEQLATEAQLRHAQKLDAMGQLTGGVAHDLNNLLTVVIGNLDLLESEGDERTRRLAQPALQAAERGAALIHRLLAFARRQALAPKRIDMNALVTGMLELLRRTLGAEVEIKLELGDDLWPVHADPVQVENALLNLTVNARDAMQEAGGHLSIETANAHLDEDYVHSNPEVEPGDYVMLAVTDTGRGMTADVAERAVEPFFTTKEVGKGSGLGLSMVYGFAKQSRGHLKIYSEPDQGTTVRLYLPRQAPDPEQLAVSEPVQAQASGGGETILVVEDDAAVRGFVLAVVRTLGYHVLEAGDASEALAMLADHPDVDLLFTDVILPGGVSGRQLAESAARLRPGLKVLFTSGYTRNSIVHQGRLDHGVSFLAKPYKREELARKLREVLDGS